MNKTLKVLSTIALIVVIASGSLFGYNQFRALQQPIGITNPAVLTTIPATDAPVVTPEPTMTPLSHCLKHQHGVNIKAFLSDDEQNMILQTNSENLELTVKGIGQCVYGNMKHVEAGQPDFKINGIKYETYYEFVIPMRADRAASQGIYVEKEITFFEFGKNVGPAQPNYVPGQYWVLMQYKPSPTATPKP